MRLLPVRPDHGGAVALLARQRQSPPTPISMSAMTNICRCGTYPRIRAAIHRAAAPDESVLRP